MAKNNRNELGGMLKQRRVMIPMTLHELADKSGVSASHLGRIERGERFPSAHVLRRMAKPLGFSEGELFGFAGYLSPQPSTTALSETRVERLDPYVASILSQQPIEVQHAVIGILAILRSIAKGYFKVPDESS